jgi:osmotically inducible protein OsmC|nr:OsmC family protein [Kofleriaceae bacterium]
MLKRNSTVVWNGNGPKGNGKITTQSGAFKEQPYSVNSRFVAEDGKAGTNPEELIAAAHASCFTMALAFQLTNAGLEPTELHTTATVSIDKQDAGWTITGIHLETEGKIPNCSKDKYAELADAAKKGCPISKALSATPITMTAKLL